jgi:cytochrome c oxidase subunit 2
MASIESPVATPQPGWARRLPLDEKVLLWVVAASVAFMSVFVVAWLAWGAQNVPSDTYRIAPAEFNAKVQEQIERFGRDGKVYLPPGEDGYIMGVRYAFYPELVLKAGTEYRLWISSFDSLHGFSIVGGGQNINLQISPEHAYGATFVPEKPGEYLIVCNEYCGLGHHQMRGRIIVEEG